MIVKRLTIAILILLLSSVVYAAGLNANTKLLMHLNGSEGQTSTTDSSDESHTIGFGGIAQLTESNKKFGTAAVSYDGATAFLAISDDASWNFASQTDCTVDFWVKHTDHAGTEAYIQQLDGVGGIALSGIFHGDGLGIGYILRNTVPVTIVSIPQDPAGEITDTDWHHVAMIKVGNEWGIYKDGDQYSHVSDADSFDIPNGTLFFAQSGLGLSFFDGAMDEFRVQFSNYFNAAPNAVTTDVIVVPTREYSSGNQTVVNAFF